MARGDGDPARTEAFPNDLPALTSIRFVFALGVVFFHYSLQWSWDEAAVTSLFNKARLGVDFFFILSGFVLTHAYRQAIEARSLHYRRFVVARLARVYPAHLAVLALVVLMVAIASAIGAEFDDSYYEPAGLVLTLLLVQSWGPEIIRAEWNGPSWSLSAEWFAYLFFPVFAAIGFALRRRPLVLLALSAITFVAIDALYLRLFGRTVVHAEINFGILRIVPEFLYGIALYRFGERCSPSRSGAVAIAVTSAALLLALMHFGADDRVIVAAAGPFLLALALLSKANPDSFLAAPPLRVAGEASYALYLLHMPLLIGWKGLHAAVTNQPSTYILSGWEVVGLLVLTIIGSLLLHSFVEQPARNWIRRLSDSRWGARAPAMPAGSQPPDV